ncbi:hypothetical protein [Pontibacter populi]|uniref:AAA+ ATPase domain-containing protein n=1 Tax=Pontibacter populi TaxID=890055 RepID=A0ABV1RXP8_9BACT
MKAEQLSDELRRLHNYLAKDTQPLWHPDIMLDAHNYKAWMMACAAFTQDKEALAKYGMRPGRGVLLTGPSGVGKSHIFILLQKYLNHVDRNQPLAFTKAQTVQYAYADTTNGGNAALSRIANKKHTNGLLVNQVFDDILAERPTKHFQEQPVYALPELITMREELFTSKGVLTHFTANYRSERIREVYGDRVLSRLLWMCDVIVFTDKATDWRAFNPLQV